MMAMRRNTKNGNFLDHVRNFKEQKLNEKKLATNGVSITPAGSINQHRNTITLEDVRYRGEIVGRIQRTIEKNTGVESVLTIADGTSRRGLQIEWLINLATSKEWTDQNADLRKRQAKKKFFNQ